MCMTRLWFMQEEVFRSHNCARAHVAELQREMDRSRRERLHSLGFEPGLAANMSAYHTKNFM
jgi:hypothetical protein